MTERNPYHPDGLWPTAGSYTRTESPDLLDGGMMCAAIEKEVEEWPLSAIDALAKMSDRVREAEQERDEALRRVRRGECAYCTEPLDYAGPPRPLTPDAITDEMRGRARKAAAAQMPDSWWGGTEWWRYADEILTAALTEPTPELTDAERLVDVLVRFPGRLAGIRDIADHLASEGVRAPGDES